jgi:hypothetical protein
VCYFLRAAVKPAANKALYEARGWKVAREGLLARLFLRDESASKEGPWQSAKRTSAGASAGRRRWPSA